MAKNDRGITLIALIVLIVVLIIISSMTLANITGDESIIGHAQNAKDSTELNDQREQGVIKNILDIGNAESSSDSQIPQTGTKLADVASIGDYVNYDPITGGNATAENTTYTSMPGTTTEHGNGYRTLSDGQTFSAAVYKNSGGKWRILEKNSDGTITLISDVIYPDSGTTMGTTGLYLEGGLGYIWAEEELHRISSIYGHGDGADLTQTVTYYYGGPNDHDGTIQEIDQNGDGVADNLAELQQGMKKTLHLNSGARALTVEDINKVCGKDGEYTANFSSSTLIKNSDNASYYPTINTTNTTTGKSAKVESPIGNYYFTKYSYIISSVNSDSVAKTMQNEMLKLGVEYWIGSRYVIAASERTEFVVRTIDSQLFGATVFNAKTGYGNQNKISRAVRAVVTLKSGIETRDTEYNEETGWNLAK